MFEGADGNKLFKEKLLPIATTIESSTTTADVSVKIGLRCSFSGVNYPIKTWKT